MSNPLSVCWPTRPVPRGGPAPWVLLISSEPSLAMLVSGYLRRIGWRARIAHGSAEALALVTFFRYDLAILDLALLRSGESEGLAAVEEIRRLSPSTRILVLSARLDATVEAEARGRGAHDVLPRPQSLEAVARAAMKLLGLAIA